MNSENPIEPPTGWFALLQGANIDLNLWQRELKQPFNPRVDRFLHGGKFIYALRSSELASSTDATELREKATPLIDRLNGALSVLVRSERVEFDGAGFCNPAGEIHLTLFIEMRDRVRTGDSVVVDVVHSRGKSLSPAEPTISDAQRWLESARLSPDFADLLVYAGRANNWFDIYKGIEVCERIMGGEHKLQSAVGELKERLKLTKSTANNHRHSRAPNPNANVILEEAADLLAEVVKIILTE